jgi:hypothetical protein
MSLCVDTHYCDSHSRYAIHLRKGDPSRAQGIQKGYDVVNDGDLVFVCDIDMIIKVCFYWAQVYAVRSDI